MCSIIILSKSTFEPLAKAGNYIDLWTWSRLYLLLFIPQNKKDWKTNPKYNKSTTIFGWVVLSIISGTLASVSGTISDLKNNHAYYYLILFIPIIYYIFCVLSILNSLIPG